MSRINHSVILTSGLHGAGKTYARCACYLGDDYLPNEIGAVWTNFPVNIEKMVSYVVKNHGGDSESIRARIRVIDESVLKQWRQGVSGPWEYFGSRPSEPERLSLWAGSYYPGVVTASGNVSMENDLISLDEAHKYIGAFTHQSNSDDKREKGQKLQKWMEFMGEIRHRGARIELITQAPDKMHPVAEMEYGARIEITNAENFRIPLLHIPYGDFLEIVSSVLRKHVSWVYETEYVKYRRKEVVNHERVWFLDPRKYELYDSYSAPEKGQESSEGKVRRQYEKGFISTLVWFIRRNYPTVVPAMLVVMFALWLGLGGGFAKVLAGTVNVIQQKVQERGNSLVVKGDNKTSQTLKVKTVQGPKVPEVLYEDNVTSSRTIKQTIKIVNGEVRKNDGLKIVMIVRNMVMFENGKRVYKGQQIGVQKLDEITSNTAYANFNGFSYACGDVVPFTDIQTTITGHRI